MPQRNVSYSVPSTRELITYLLIFCFTRSIHTLFYSRENLTLVWRLVMSFSPTLTHPLHLQWHGTYQEFHYTGNLGTVCCFQRTEKSLGCVPRSNGCDTGCPLHYTGSTLTTLTSHLKCKSRKCTDNITKKEKDPLWKPYFSHARERSDPHLGLFHTSNLGAFRKFNRHDINNSASIIIYLSDCNFLNTE